jgi:hypothetical protein
MEEYGNQYHGRGLEIADYTLPEYWPTVMPTNSTIMGSSVDASTKSSALNKSACSPHKVTMA